MDQLSRSTTWRSPAGVRVLAAILDEAWNKCATTCAQWHPVRLSIELRAPPAAPPPSRAAHAPFRSLLSATKTAQVGGKLSFVPPAIGITGARVFIPSRARGTILWFVASQGFLRRFHRRMCKSAFARRALTGNGMRCARRGRGRFVQTTENPAGSPGSRSRRSTALPRVSRNPHRR